jgi:hypothetical protein
MGGLRANAGTPTNIELFNGSDRRIKNILGPMDNTLDKVLAVNLVKYSLKKNENIVGEGVIAQELETTHPELVTTDSNGYKLVNYSRLNEITGGTYGE